MAGLSYFKVFTFANMDKPNSRASSSSILGSRVFDQDTGAMDDPSAFTCTVRCQKAIHIPDEISIKVPQSRTPMSLFLNRYRVFLDKAQYIHSVTKRCKYKSEPTSASIGHI